MMNGPVPLSSGETVMLSGAGAIAGPDMVWSCIVAPGPVWFGIAAGTGAMVGAAMVWSGIMETGMSIDCIEPRGTFTSRSICSIIGGYPSRKSGRRVTAVLGAASHELAIDLLGRPGEILVGWGRPRVGGFLAVSSSSLPSRLPSCGAFGGWCCRQGNAQAGIG